MNPTRSAFVNARLSRTAISSLLVLLSVLPLAGCGPIIGTIVAVLVSDDDGGGSTPPLPLLGSKALLTAPASLCDVPPSTAPEEVLAWARNRRGGLLRIGFRVEVPDSTKCVAVEAKLTDAAGRPLVDPSGAPIPFVPGPESADLSCLSTGDHVLEWDTSAIRGPVKARLGLRPVGGREEDSPIEVWVDNRPPISVEILGPPRSGASPGLGGEIEIPFRYTVLPGDPRELRQVALSFRAADGTPVRATAEILEDAPVPGEEMTLLWRSERDLPLARTAGLSLLLSLSGDDLACAIIGPVDIDNLGPLVTDVTVSSLPAAREPDALVGLVVVEYTVVGGSTAPLEATVEASLSDVDGGTPFDPTPAGGFAPTEPIVATPEGAVYRFVWNSDHDADRFLARATGADPARLGVGFTVGVLDAASGRSHAVASRSVRAFLDTTLVHTIAGRIEGSPLPIPGANVPATSVEIPVATGIELVSGGALRLAVGDTRTARLLDPASRLFGAEAGRAPEAGDLVECDGEEVTRRFSGKGGVAVRVLLGAPGSLESDTNGNRYVADTQDHAVWAISKKGNIRRFAGRALSDCAARGEDPPPFDSAQNKSMAFTNETVLATDVTLNSPSGLLFDERWGADSIFLSDTRHDRVLRVFVKENRALRVAGRGGPFDPASADCRSPAFQDPREAALGDGGYARDAVLREPGALAIDHVGNLYIADAGHNRIRRVDLRSSPPIITTVAGSGSDGSFLFPPDCDPARDPALALESDGVYFPLELPLSRPSGLVLRRAGGDPGAPATHLLFGETGMGRIWSLDLASGRAAMEAAGSATGGPAGEGASPLEARFEGPMSLEIDALDHVYVAGKGGVRRFRARLDEPDPEEGTFTLDAGEAGTTASGLWFPSKGSSPHLGSSLYARDQAASYRFAFEVPAGTYEIHAWWTQFPSRSPRVAYRIETAAGTREATVDQRIGGGQWNLLGEHALGTKPVVTILTRPDGASYSADAVLLRRVEP